MKNFKINTNRPPLTDAELAGKADFNQLLKSYNALKTPFFKTPKFMFGASAILVATVAAIIIYGKVAGTEAGNPPFINPPVAQADIKTTTYVIDAGRDSNITYTSGSKIHIPANAFTDENGKPVDGKVDLNYREFKKVSEVFIAGIPMTYDSAGEQFHFETAGMMEISATQNGKPLKTNPNAFITVDMVSANNEDKFNTYYLDTTDKKWKYLAQQNYNQPTATQPSNTENAATEPSTPEPDKAIINELKKTQNEIAKLEQQKPVEPKAVNKDKHRFNIKVDEKEFPEIAIYSNMKFEVADKNYDAKKAQVLWEDISMKRIDNSLNYEITFSNARENYKVIATPVFADKDLKSAQKIYDQKFKEYQAKLAQRKADEAKLKAEVEARAKLVEEKIKQEIAEQAERRRKYEAKLAQTDLVYRTFQVADFGIWNCDCPNRLPAGATVIAKLQDAKTKEALNIQYCYLVEKGRNAMFTYYPTSLNGFKFDPTKENMIWAITNDLKVAVMKPAEFKAAQKTSGTMQLELNVVDRNFKTSDEVREYLEI
jgi:hypothetical protein